MADVSLSMVSYRVRAAQAADLDALVALEEAVFDYDRISRRQYRQHLVGTSALVLVAVDRGDLLGSGMVFFRHGTRVARLYSLATAPGARGRGVAQRLLAAFERAARQRGCDRLRLEVRTDNDAAIGLYERLGYRRFGLRSGYYDDGTDALRFEKELSRRTRVR